jgi:hypothetical protein
MFDVFQSVLKDEAVLETENGSRDTLYRYVRPDHRTSIIEDDQHFLLLLELSPSLLLGYKKLKHVLDYREKKI